MGDLVLVGALQFAHPTLGSAFDADPKSATQQRLRVLKMAVRDNDWIAGAHLSFPGVGHLRFIEAHYLWIPASFAIPEGGSSEEGHQHGLTDPKP
jgi:hypothetical protein